MIELPCRPRVAGWRSRIPLCSRRMMSPASRDRIHADQRPATHGTLAAKIPGSGRIDRIVRCGRFPRSSGDGVGIQAERRARPTRQTRTGTPRCVSKSAIRSTSAVTAGRGRAGDERGGPAARPAGGVLPGMMASGYAAARPASALHHLERTAGQALALRPAATSEQRRHLVVARPPGVEDLPPRSAPTRSDQPGVPVRPVDILVGDGIGAKGPATSCSPSSRGPAIGLVAVGEQPAGPEPWTCAFDRRCRRRQHPVEAGRLAQRARQALLLGEAPTPQGPHVGGHVLPARRVPVTPFSGAFASARQSLRGPSGDLRGPRPHGTKPWRRLVGRCRPRRRVARLGSRTATRVLGPPPLTAMWAVSTSRTSPVTNSWLLSTSVPTHPSAGRTRVRRRPASPTSGRCRPSRPEFTLQGDVSSSVGGDQGHGARALVDLAALDADQPVLDHVEAAPPARAAGSARRWPRAR